MSNPPRNKLVTIVQDIFFPMDVMGSESVVFFRVTTVGARRIQTDAAVRGHTDLSVVINPDVVAQSPPY